MANTFLGKAQVSGTSGTLTIDSVELNALKEGMDFTHEFEEDIIKDEQGNDAAWRAFNEKYTGDIKMRLVATNADSTFAEARALAAALTPYAVVTITDCEIESWGGTAAVTYQLVSGSPIGLTNTTAGSMSWKLRRYADATQNALAAHTPV